MKTIITLLILIVSSQSIYADRKEISKAYSYISDTFKNPKTQPRGFYYNNKDGFPYMYEGEPYKTHVVRVISNTKGCRGSVMLDLINDAKRVRLWYRYDLTKQSFHIRNDLIVLASEDDNSTITLNYRFKDEDGKSVKLTMQNDYIYFGWRAHGSNGNRLKQSFMKYSELCKSSRF